MRTLLTAFLLVTRCALAQLDDVAFVGSLTTLQTSVPFSPTNIAGYPAYSWYPVSGNYSGTVLTNLASTSDNNLLSGATPPQIKSGAINGLDYLAFSGSQSHLFTAGHKVSQPIEYVIVVNYTNTGPNNYLITSTNGGIRNVMWGDSADGLSFNIYASGGAVNKSVVVITNKWFVLNAVFNDTSSVIYTNAVAGGSGSAIGTDSQQGLVIGGNEARTGLWPSMGIAEIIAYGTNLGAIDSAGTFTASAVRSNVFRYLTNKYAITP